MASSLMAGCTGVQSALDPASEEAESVAALFWWMTGGAALIWIAMVGLALWVSVARPSENRRSQGHRLIHIGAVSTAVILAALLVFGLALLPGMTLAEEEPDLRIAVTGQQWWWSFRYQPEGQLTFEVPNELWLPVGETIEFTLASRDVVHSFWIPSLGGKIDLIPGRENLLVLHPTKVGSFRGVCAEFCGRAHAQMAFRVVVASREDFNRWMEVRLADANPGQQAEGLP